MVAFLPDRSAASPPFPSLLCAFLLAIVGRNRGDYARREKEASGMRTETILSSVFVNPLRGTIQFDSGRDSRATYRVQPPCSTGYGVDSINFN